MNVFYASGPKFYFLIVCALSDLKATSAKAEEKATTTATAKKTSKEKKY